jgi:uncharacterized membrane protein
MGFKLTVSMAITPKEVTRVSVAEVVHSITLFTSTTMFLELVKE